MSKHTRSHPREWKRPRYGICGQFLPGGLTVACTGCGRLVTRSIPDRLDARDFDGRTLRWWERRLERIVRDRGKFAKRAYFLRQDVLRAMSDNLPSYPIALDRIGLFPDHDMQQQKVDRYAACEVYHKSPVVLRGQRDGSQLTLLDGRHRVTAARRKGARFLRAVFT